MFYQELESEKRDTLYKREYRRKMDKDLKKIFPTTGAGSAKSPESYSQDILDLTISELWDPYKDIE
jgi:glutathionyl-hydroquinone reductase